MKKRILILLYIALALFPLTISCNKEDQKLSAEEIYELVSPSVVAITAESPTTTSSGTGFFYNNGSTIVTNYHVIKDCSSASITLSNGEKYDVLNVLGYDKDKDIAILEVDYKGGIPLEIRTSEVKTGETVYAIGNSLGFLEGSLSEGIISTAQRELDGQTYIQTTAAVTHGNSGGPLIDSYGKIIGIVSAGFGDGLDLNLAIPIAQVGSVDVSQKYSFDSFLEKDAPIYSVDYVLSNLECLANSTFYIECWASTFEFYPSGKGWVYCTNTENEVYYPTTDIEKENAYNYDRQRSLNGTVIRVEYRYNFAYLEPPALSLGDKIQILCVGIEPPFFYENELVTAPAIIALKMEIAK